VRAQGDKSLGLLAVPAFEHPDDGGLEVVVPDQGRYGSEILERQHVAFQEGFLRLGGERDMERAARMRQPHHEHPQLQQDPGDRGVELAEVDLRLGAGQVRLRHRHFGLVQAQLRLAAGDIAGDRDLGDRGTMLGYQPLPDPPCRMPLLARHLPVRDQPAVNDLRVRIDRRPRARRIGPARRRHRAGQRLPHRPPVHPMPGRQFPDR
jgi:hypothetical protein